MINASDKTLRRFKSILIEYHYGYEKLEKKLKQAGFIIKSRMEEGYTSNVNVKNQQMNQGIILAEKAK